MTAPTVDTLPALNPATDALTAAMHIPTFDNAVLTDVLRLIRSTITAAALDAKDGDVLGAGKKGKSEAQKQLKNALWTNHLNGVQRTALMNRTGLRHDQVLQFDRDTTMTLMATVQSWFPASSKKAGKVAASGELTRLGGVVQDMPLDVFQQLKTAGLTAGDTVTFKLGDRSSLMTVDRGGKKAYAIHDAEAGTLSKSTAADARTVGQNNMRLGRARRIARELRANGGDWAKLTKGDTAWLNKDGAHRALTEAQYRKMLS